MFTIAPTMPPQVLIDTPTWILFVIFGVIGAIALFSAFAYIMIKGGRGDSAAMLALLIFVAVLGVLMPLWTPRVLREQGFTGIDVPLMTVKIILTNMLTSIVLPALMLMVLSRVTWVRKPLNEADSESHE